MLRLQHEAEQWRNLIEWIHKQYGAKPWTVAQVVREIPLDSERGGGVELPDDLPSRRDPNFVKEAGKAFARRKDRIFELSDGSTVRLRKEKRVGGVSFWRISP